MKMVDAVGNELELVCPRWWRLDRWLVWLFATNGWIGVGDGRVRIRTTRAEDE